VLPPITERTLCRSTTVAFPVCQLCQDAVKNSLSEENLTDSCALLNKVCDSLEKYPVWIATTASSDCAMTEIRPLRHSLAQASLNRKHNGQQRKTSWDLALLAFIG
jgi:hypothetical protein